MWLAWWYRQLSNNPSRNNHQEPNSTHSTHSIGKKVDTIHYERKGDHVCHWDTRGPSRQQASTSELSQRLIRCYHRACKVESTWPPSRCCSQIYYRFFNKVIISVASMLLPVSIEAYIGALASQIQLAYFPLAISMNRISQWPTRLYPQAWI